MSVPPPLAIRTLAVSGLNFTQDDALEGNLNSYTETSMTSPLTATSTGVINNQYGGKYLVSTAASNFPSGSLVTVANVGETAGSLIRVKIYTPGPTEDQAESQIVGVALNDGVTGSPVRVAISGICTVLASAAFTATRGALLISDQAAQPGKCRITAGADNDASVGICLSIGAKVLNSTVLVALRTGFEVF